MINGDKLSGDFVSLSEDKLVLNTWYAGKLTLNRHAIQTLVPGQTKLETLYQGPNSEDVKQWKHTNSGTYKWTFKNFQKTSKKNLKVPQRDKAAWSE